MRSPLHDVWGCGRGPVRSLRPHVRLLAGCATLVACMVAPATTAAGALAMIAMVAVWLAACRPPLPAVRTTVLLGLVLFLPYFLLLPLLAPTPDDWRKALLIPWRVLLRGMSGMLVSLATVSCLSASDLREAMVRLPLPNLITSILLQIIQQTATLFYETKQVAAALAVRGASSGGTTAWRVISSLPLVWFPRIIARAERVAVAMELRGYCEGEGRPLRQARIGLADVAVLLLAAGAVALATALRLRLGGTA